MKRFRRWQDWVALAAGIVAAISSAWTPQTMKASPVVMELGVAIAVMALINLAAPRSYGWEWMQFLLGALMGISPWAMRFSNAQPAATTAWIIGAVTVIVAVWTALQVPIQRARAGTENAKKKHSKTPAKGRS